MFLLWHASSSSDLPALCKVFKARPFDSSLLKSAEWFSWSLLRWMWCPIQATCFPSAWKQPWQITPALWETRKKHGITLRNRRTHHRWDFGEGQEWFSPQSGIWTVLSYRVHNHSCLLSYAFLWSQSQGCQEHLQERRHLNSEWELQSELRVNFTPFPSLYLCSPFDVPQATLQNNTDGTCAECNTIMEHRW